MGLSTVQENLKRMAVQSVAVLSIFLLLLPALGPQLDHHFAERRPDHSHVFLGSPSPEHSHPFEEGGHHAHHQHPLQPQPGGTVYLTSDEGMGQAFAGVASSMVQESVRFSAPDGGVFLLGPPRRTAAMRGAFVGPPDNPPRI